MGPACTPGMQRQRTTVLWTLGDGGAAGRTGGGGVNKVYSV